MADETWPDIAAITATIQADNDANPDTTEASSAATEEKVPSAESIAAALAQADGAKTVPATPADPSAQPKQKVDPSPAKVETPADLTTLAASIKEDPRKALATLPEDVVEAMQSVLYPKLHQKLSKRDNEHRAELARRDAENRAALAAATARIDERIDEVLSRTMEPEQFEEYKRHRGERIAAEVAKNAPDPVEAARQAELQAYVVQAWDMIADHGFPIPEDRTEFSDMTEEVKAIWQAGWNEKTPIAASRAMRAKAREIKAAGGRVTPPATITQPRDPQTGKFVSNDELTRLIAEGVKKAREGDELRAGLAVTGARGGNANTSGGKAQSWTENTRDLATALREANARS